MKLGKYIIKNISGDYPHNWFNLFPFIAIQHKYWYLWEINFGWLGFDRMYEICDETWNDNSEMYCQVTGEYFYKTLSPKHYFNIILSKKDYKTSLKERMCGNYNTLKEKIAESYDLDPLQLSLICISIKYSILQK